MQRGWCCVVAGHVLASFEGTSQSRPLYFRSSSLMLEPCNHVGGLNEAQAATFGVVQL